MPYARILTTEAAPPNSAPQTKAPMATMAIGIQCARVPPAGNAAFLLRFPSAADVSGIFYMPDEQQIRRQSRVLWVHWNWNKEKYPLGNTSASVRTHILASAFDITR